MPSPSTFNEDYFLRGPETGLSNYVDYRWLPEATLPYACALAGLLGIVPGDEVWDFGCARGYLVKALRMMGVEAYGNDVSAWAIANCDPDIEPYVGAELPDMVPAADYVISKDVLEHIALEDLDEVIRRLDITARKGMLFVVPLTIEDGGAYVRAEDEADSTHVIRWTFATWLTYLMAELPHTTVWGTMHVEGVKRASGDNFTSTGFFRILK